MSVSMEANISTPSGEEESSEDILVSNKKRIFVGNLFYRKIW